MYTREMFLAIALGIPVAMAVSAPLLISQIQFYQRIEEESIYGDEFADLIDTTGAHEGFMNEFAAHLFYFCGAGDEQARIEPITDYAFHRRILALLENNVKFIPDANIHESFQVDFADRKIRLNPTMDAEDVAYECWKTVMSMDPEEYKAHPEESAYPILAVNMR